MRVEKFIGSDMREAMSSVRIAFGRDAVILSSRRIDDKTEVMAAMDYEPSQENSKKILLETSRLSSDSEVSEIITKAEISPSIQEIQDELGKLRKLFEGELAQLAWRDMSKRQPNRFALIQRLELAGINCSIATNIVDKVLPCKDIDQGWRKTLGSLGGKIMPYEHDILKDGGVIALVGSTGVGKTTTAAKIAARFALRYGRKHVAFISTDKYKVGGQEQLVSFGSILGIPVQIAPTVQQMKRTLASLSERKLVIIDTAGMSQRDMMISEQFEMLTIAGAKIKPLLVLPATARQTIINETIKAYSKLNIEAAILTKMDECDAIGGLLSSVIENKMPLAFTTNGQKVPEDLHEVEPKRLLAEIIKSYKSAIKSKNIPELNQTTSWAMST